jgi:phage shock protein PspC (stress-responsive transcriptional regulator)
MKKVLHINLGSYPFTIDIDAYDLIDGYFVSLEKHFSKSENPEEIIFDIETRMAELFHENAGEDSILTKKDIEEAIKVMGKPEDFDDAEDIPNAETAGKESTRKKRDESFHYTTGKKLYRDPDNKVVSGVCSGFSAYLGIDDPIWLRIFTAVMTFFTGGVVFVVYIILSIVIPKARTSADRMAMRGERIDIDTVAESVEEEISALSEQFQDWAQNFREKRKQKRFRRKRKY